MQNKWITLLLGLALASTPMAFAQEDISDEAGSTQSGSNFDAPNEGLSTYDNQSASFMDSVSVNYFGILYGPSVTEPTSHQPTANGIPDPERPVFVKNYMTLGYSMSDTLMVSASAYWTWIPVQGQNFAMRDPYLRIANTSLISSGNFNLYADARVHLPVTTISRQNDMLMGFQAFQISSYQVGTSRLSVGAYTSARMNVFGSSGYGPDLELYLGPNLTYQVSPKVGLTLLYEMGMSHMYGDAPFQFVNDGTDLEPGVNWEITPNLAVNPYLHLTTGEKVTLKTTSFGMTLSWILI